MFRLLLAASLLAASLGATAAPELRRSGFLGVQVAPLPAGNAGPGIVVAGLVDAGSARLAGVQQDDVIIALDGREVASPGAFAEAARRLRAGDVAALRLVRAGQAMTLDVPVKPRPMERGDEFDVVYGAVAVDGHLRRTLLTRPRGGARHPAVLFVTGVGCFSQEIADPRDGVAQLLHGLTRAGFATLRVEKSGMGDSQGPACSSPQVDMEAEVRGYVAGLRALKADPSVDPERVFIVGLSIGGVEAPLIEREEAVQGVVVINTAAKPFYEYVLETYRRQMILRGQPYDAVDRNMARVARCQYAVLLEKRSPEAVVKDMPECREHVQFPAPHTFMQQWAALNMGEVWKATRAPLLVVIGASDFVATVSESPYLVSMVNSFHPGRATLRVIEGMDHSMAKAPSMQASLERKGPAEFEPAVLEATASWLRRAAGI